MMKKQLYIFMAFCLFGIVSNEHAAASSTQRKIILPKVSPSQALVYFNRNMNQRTYATINIPALDAHARAKLIADLKARNESVKGQLYTENADTLRVAYATVPTDNQSFFELSIFHVGRVLPVVLHEISKSTERTVKDLLQDEQVLDTITTGFMATDALKTYCIVRAFQHVYKSPMDEDAFALFGKEAKEIIDAFVKAVSAGDATVKLQEPNPALDAVWEEVSSPTLAEIRVFVQVALNELREQQENC